MVQVHPDSRQAACLQCLKFPQTALQPLTPPAQGLMNGLRRGGEPALQDGQGEADGSCTFVVGEGVGPVEFLFHIIGDRLIEALFFI